MELARRHIPVVVRGKRMNIFCLKIAAIIFLALPDASYNGGTLALATTSGNNNDDQQSYPPTIPSCTSLLDFYEQGWETVTNIPVTACNHTLCLEFAQKFTSYFSDDNMTSLYTPDGVMRGHNEILENWSSACDYFAESYCPSRAGDTIVVERVNVNSMECGMVDANRNTSSTTGWLHGNHTDIHRRSNGEILATYTTDITYLAGYESEVGWKYYFGEYTPVVAVAGSTITSTTTTEQQQEVGGGVTQDANFPSSGATAMFSVRNNAKGRIVFVGMICISIILIMV